MATGWTWDYVAESMDIPRLKKMQHYWQDNPPVHVMVAAYLGIKKRKPPKIEAADIEALMRAYPQTTPAK